MSKQYKYFKIGLASPEEILSWSHGEVLKHETINYRTLKPEPDGLFCEKIFGPTKDYRCACGKSKSNNDKGKICEKCGVEITESKVRRERMGHIKLASPVVHTWFLRNSPSPIALLLELSTKEVEEIVYLASYYVFDKGKTDISKKVISEAEYAQKMEQYPNQFKALTGAEAIKKLLQNIDLEEEAKKLRKDLKSNRKQKRDKVIKRLEIVEAFLKSDNKPEWMVLDVLPVIPPNLRPMVQLEGGRFATTDLNDLYRRILNRNNRLKKQYEQHAPHLITKNEKRMLQEAVDALIDNSKRGTKKAAADRTHHLKSLSDMLRGKQGRFRQNLLGKRVDYSGRSVIVIGPSLKMYQCGIPKEMALTLFKPFVLRELTRNEKDKNPNDNSSKNLANANNLVDKQDPVVWRILEEVIREHPVLLNRAPTLHRLGIQAFEPILIEGKAIRLHPLACTPFNADFDGDQMAVHVPLSLEAQAEARLLMLASNNILNPKDGKPVVTPTQDMILGNYYLSLEYPGENNEGHFFRDYDEAYMAYKNGDITLHTRIFVDVSYLPQEKFAGVEYPSKYLFTTMGKMIFNTILPDEFPYVNDFNQSLNESTPVSFFLNTKGGAEAYNAMINAPACTPFKKKLITRIISEVFKRYKITETSKMLDKIKDLGYKYSTISGLSISMADVIDYKGKQSRIEEADKRVDQINSFCYDKGLLTNAERKKLCEAEWNQARDNIKDGLWKALANQKNNSIYMMADSGSRGSASNFAQLAGMRGLMSNTANETIEVPVKANFREGLSVSEFFISTHGSRKGSTDTALKTAESGYLTRRLVVVSHNVVISTEDCGTEKGFDVKAIYDENTIDPQTNKFKKIVSVGDRCLGRFAAKDIVNPLTGEVICHRNELVNEEMASQIDECQIESACIRTNLTCECKNGVCMKCYGRNLATNTVVEVGEAVGTIAAQSIGEPGTQLTMRTFHNGGVATGDITQGLPRVQELFEARKPKGKTTLSEIDGVVEHIVPTKAGDVVTIKGDPDAEGKCEEKNYTIDATAEKLISEGKRVKRGDKLVKGSIHLKELLNILDAEAVERYLVDEVQKVYRSQEVEIADKHIEIIVRQMMRKVNVVSEGDSDLLPGKDVSIAEFNDAVKTSITNGTKLPVARQLILGITKAALGSDSFLSATSFQETTRILTMAAIQSKRDTLRGLNENVIIGGLIPAGTGILEEDSFTCEHKPASLYDEVKKEAESHEEYVSVHDNDDDDYNDFDANFEETALDDIDN